jgi:hypothetical protein
MVCFAHTLSPPLHILLENKIKGGIYMGCRSKKGRNDNVVLGVENDFNNNCVCDVVRAIADAQEDAIEVQCDVSCAKSIQNLVSPVRENDLDTVPFILYCEGTCEPFKAFGADIQMDGQPRFDCIESFIFRVSEVDDDCCARLELLTFDGDPQQPGDQKGAKCDKDPCDQLNGKKVRDLQGTDVCITVDLNDFAAITCLPAVDLF